MHASVHASVCPFQFSVSTSFFPSPSVLSCPALRHATTKSHGQHCTAKTTYKCAVKGVDTLSEGDRGEQQSHAHASATTVGSEQIEAASKSVFTCPHSAVNLRPGIATPIQLTCSGTMGDHKNGRGAWISYRRQVHGSHETAVSASRHAASAYVTFNIQILLTFSTRKLTISSKLQPKPKLNLETVKREPLHQSVLSVVSSN